MEPMDSGNVWVARVLAARRSLPAWLALLIGAAILFVSFGPIQELTSNHSPVSGGSPLWSAVLDRATTYLSIFVPFYLCVFVSVRLWEERARLAGALGRFNAALVGALVGLASFVLVLLISLIAGNLQLETPISVPGLETIAGVSVSVLLFAFQSSAEEWFFRGWLQPLLAADWGAWVAVLLCAALFAGAHGVGAVSSATGFLNVFLAGALFGLLTLRTGSLWAGTMAHGLWNWLEQSIVGLTPNPGIDALGSVVDLKLVGSGWAGGGPDELNGALAVTLVLASAVVLLAVLPSRRVTSL